ncbi:dihydrofolate reductase family protein [Devosia sp.]|uniref:dihydrofolate reductase family protein n=1 Tax=Devosia sp. TaxID=1871048 RepID=UPI003266027B
MSKVVASFTMSLDGYSAGPDQTLENPLGIGAKTLHRWLFDGADDNQAETAALLGHGAFIMGRNMFGPIRGEWDLDWRGWWGEEPPYHGPVFVLTHHQREPLVMSGGTTFHFVTDGIASALGQARQAAGDKSISIAGGASTVRQYLNLGAVDELNIQLSPMFLGAGERPLDGLQGVILTSTYARYTPLATHLRYLVSKT